MEGYELPVRITATAVMLLGVSSHSIVLYLTAKKPKADNQAYLLFMKIYSTVSIVRLICGWSLINRSVKFTEATVIISYGLGSLFGGIFCVIVDAVGSLCVNLIYVLVPTGMALRCLITFQRRIQSKHVLLVAGIILIFEVPDVALKFYAYVPIMSFYSQLTPENQRELLHHSGYAMVRRSLWESYYSTFTSYHPYFCVPITFILVGITAWRLWSYRKQMTTRTAQIHSSFIWLLSLEATALCLSFVRNLASSVIPNSELSTILYFYAHPLTASIPAIQGWTMLCLIPYFRRELLSFFGKATESKNSSIARLSNQNRISTVVM